MRTSNILPELHDPPTTFPVGGVAREERSLCNPVSAAQLAAKTVEVAHPCKAPRHRKRKPETREELISRLFNPTLTLEETALMLDVCPATVRRYTNRGILPHERSKGNQRRFKLSSVVAFMEANRVGRALVDE